LEERKLHFQGVFAAPGEANPVTLAGVVNGRAQLDETVAELSVNRDLTKGCPVGITGERRHSFKRIDVTWRDDDDAIEVEMRDALVGVRCHLSRIGVSGVRCDQRNDSLAVLWTRGELQQMRYLVLKLFFSSGIEKSRHCRITNLL
jgi:hypothetical protein